MSDNGTYQQQGRRQLAQAADAHLPEAHDVTGGERAADSPAGIETFAKEAKRMSDILTDKAGLTFEQFMTSREFPLPIYRALMYKRLHSQGCSIARIGRLYGKNHATVIHSLKTLESYLAIPDKEVLEITYRFEQYMKQTKTENMSKLFFTEISYSGGLRKVEADIWPTMTDTFRHALVHEEALDALKRNVEQLIEQRAAELKVKPVPVVLSGAWDKFKDASLPRFMSAGRITVTLTEVRNVIGQTPQRAEA